MVPTIQFITISIQDLARHLPELCTARPKLVGGLLISSFLAIQLASASILAALPAFLVSFALGVAVAVMWHRRLLCAVDFRQSSELFRVGRAYAVIVAVIVVAGLFLVFVSVFVMSMAVHFLLPSGGFGGGLMNVIVVSALGHLLASYVMARLSIMLPACAIGKKVALDRSWNVSRDRHWPLTWAYFSIGIANSLINYLYSAFFGHAMMADGLVSNILATVLGNAVAFLNLAVLTRGYLLMTVQGGDDTSDLLPAAIDHPG